MGTKIYAPFGSQDVMAGASELYTASDAEAKAQALATRLLTADNLAQGAPAVAVGTLEAMFVQHYQIAPDAVGAASVHAAITLADGATTTVTTAITSPDVPRVLSIVGNAAGITGNVVVTGTNIAGATITDTIAANGTTTVNGAKAFKTVTQIVVPARNAGGDTISIGTAKIFGLPHIVYNAAMLLVKLFDGSTDTGTLAVDGDEVEKNLFSLNGTPDGSKLLDLYYLK